LVMVHFFFFHYVEVRESNPISVPKICLPNNVVVLYLYQSEIVIRKLY